ncbi:MAG TPA: hypothetical protein VMT03_08635 [Polyangia bacterium]|nr:hypothetical protein [Polyangia bacterium]
MPRWALAVLLVAFVSGGPGEVARAEVAQTADGWVTGGTARLRIDVKESPRHDVSDGSVAMRLETLSDHRAIAAKTMEGTWRVLAYVPSAHMFVLGGQFEVGAWLPLNVISYVDEATGVARQARHSEDWMALAAVPSPDGRFIVFVGALGEHYFRLQVLDTVKDALYELGQPPAPPPEPHPVAEGSGREWDWGDPIDGVTEMDPGIVTFPDDHTLRVTYGRDTARGRAAKRTVRTWDLQQVVAKRRPVGPAKSAP